MSASETSIILLCNQNNACTLLKDLVMGLPYKVDVCGNVTDALRLQGEYPRDIVIAEFNSNDTSGLDFLKLIYKNYRSTARILVGDDADEQQIIKAVIKGVACAYINGRDSRQLIKQKLDDINRIRAGLSDRSILNNLPGSNELPINMTVYETLMEAINNDASISYISNIISKDITLTSKVLQVANSAFYGNFSGTSVEKAILYMGLNPVKDIVLLHSLSTNLRMNEQQNKELSDIIKHSIETNYYLHAIAKKAGNCPITAINNSIGIIHGIGKLVQLVAFPMEYSTIDEYREEHPNTDYYTCEINTGNTAIKHSEIGAYFLRNWNFNQYSVEAALFHHEPELASVEVRPCVEALFLANTIADIRDGFDLSLEDAVARCKTIKLEPNDILTILPPL